MTWLPPRVPLEDPPGNPEALADLLATVTGAAFRLGVLSAHLAGPAARAPGWIGADAAAAATQIGTVAGLLERQHDAVGEAVQRLSAHREVLLDVLGRIRALRAAQEDDYAVAAARLHPAAGGADAGWDAGVLADLERAERSRAREHARLHAEVADDAAATAAVLAAATDVVGGRGRPGDADQVLAHLAAHFPGWGVPALAAAGSAIGRAARTWSAAEVNRALRADSALLDSPAYAAALLSAMGAERFAALVGQLGLPETDGRLPHRVATLVGAAWGDGGRPFVAGPSGELRAPLAWPLDAASAVGLGRMARSGRLPPALVAELLRPLAAAERADPWLRRDQLAAAPAEDPLADVLGALSRTRDADLVAGALADPDLWPGLLGRTWTEGTTALTDAIRVAATGERGGALTTAVLDAVGATVDLVVTHQGNGLPEAFTIAAVSDAVGELVAANLTVVTDTVLVSLGETGVPGRPLDAGAARLLAGLGLVTASGGARVAVLEAVVAATAAAPPPVGAGVQAPAAYAHGGVFAAMAYGEEQDIRRRLYAAVARQQADELSGGVITAPLALLPGRAGPLPGLLADGAGLLGPGELPLEAFWERPETGAPQAAFSVVAAAVGPAVAAGVLPGPGHALDHGLGSAAARAYEAALLPAQRDVWDELIAAANAGFLAVGQHLGLLPG